MNIHYQNKLYLAEVDKENNIIGKVERWTAHRKGILHRGFTVILQYQNYYILQNRKHPAFDKLWDLTFSSHPVYQNNYLDSDESAIYSAFIREWNVKKQISFENFLPKYIGRFYYRAKDNNSIYTEHEIDYVYKVELPVIPTAINEFAYKSELVPLDNFNKYFVQKYKLSPWVQQMLIDLKIA